jgi:uncharacterized RDD family membrane protein YckC
MSKKKRPTELELPLFDLPLHANDEMRDGGVPGGTALLEEPVEEPVDFPRADLTLDDEPPETPRSDPEPVPAAAEESDEPEEEVPAPPRDRLLSGLLDLGIQLLVLGGAAASVHAMGIELRPGDAPPFAVLELIFSFLYWFIPLAFWGQTPGMAWVGNSAVSVDDEPLTFGQSVLRWLGALLTFALLGLPMALALGGRSLTDRLSDSKTIVI